MSCKFQEPDLDDVIDDPIVRAVMMRDAVEEGDLRRLIDRVRFTLGPTPNPCAQPGFGQVEARVG